MTQRENRPSRGTRTAQGPWDGDITKNTPNTRPYEVGAPIYQKLGWTGILPVNPADKGGVPKGFTGRDGIDVTPENLAWFIKSKPAHNITLRTPPDIIGVDVDAHSGKTGADTLTEAQHRWGRLPPTYMSTSRDDGTSGIRLYRIPAGAELVDRIEFPELGLGDIEICQRHHRHIMCWPSIHPDTGRTYRWVDQLDGSTMDTPPAPCDPPHLPQAWLNALTKPSAATHNGSTPPAGVAPPVAVGQALTDGEPTRRVSQKLGDAIRGCYGGSRHDTTRDHVLGLLRCGKQGDTGVRPALHILRDVFITRVGPDRPGGPDEAAAEFDKFVTGPGVPQLLSHTGYDPPDPPPGDNWEPPDEPPDGGDSGDVSQLWYERNVDIELAKMRVRAEARRRLDDETRPPAHHPPVRNLDTLLATTFDEQRHRIDKVAPADARIMLSAQYKAGKTTLVGNIIRALADGEPFLDHFAVHIPARRIVLIDDEMSERTVQRWLRDQRITNTAAVADVVTLRGNVAAFNLLDPQCFNVWAERLTGLGCDYLILDCLRPILDALGLDENRDAGQFLVRFDALLKTAGIGDALLVQHMGHSNERARGDSRLQDWPDALWRLVREDDNPESARFFSAYGRDVDVREGRLAFDTDTRRLRYVAGSRADAKTDAALVAVVERLAEHERARRGEQMDEGVSGRALEEMFTGEHSRRSVRAALTHAVERGLVAVAVGPRRARLHHIKHPCSECGMPVADGGGRHMSCPDSPEGLFE